MLQSPGGFFCFMDGGRFAEQGRQPVPELLEAAQPVAAARLRARQLNTALLERVVLSPAKVSPQVKQSRPKALIVFRDAYMVEFIRPLHAKSPPRRNCAILSSSRSRAAKVPPHSIESRILVLRNLRVMIDADLATLYGVTTKRLNEQVKRNAGRFPGDFMFQLNAAEKAGGRKLRPPCQAEVLEGAALRVH